MATRNSPSEGLKKQGDAPAPTMDASSMAEPGDWLSLALEHHVQIRSAFTRAQQAAAGGPRLAALKGLATVLNGHSLAEEVVLYPALARIKAREAVQAYDEQSIAKIEMSKLELLDPASEEWIGQLQKIQAAVLHHMEEEESGWFMTLKTSAESSPKLTARYKEEFERYTRTGAIATNAAWDAPPRQS